MTVEWSFTRIYLLRHGLVAPEERKKFNGVTDAALDPEGLEQHRRAGEYLSQAGLAALYCSPLSRCRDSAGALGRVVGLRATVVEGIREMNFGVMEGLGFSEVRAKYPEQSKAFYDDLADYRVEGGETMAEVQDRACRALDGIAAAHPRAQAAVVAHGAVNRLILARALNLDIQNVMNLSQDYGCINIIDYYPDRTVVKAVNILPGQIMPDGYEHF